MKFNAVGFTVLVLSSSAARADTYNLAESQTLEQKKLYCASNTQTCDVACSYKTSSNTCDPASLKWYCACADNAKLAVATVQFPIEVNQCNGEVLDCVDQCLRASLGGDRNICSDKCKAEYLCGQPGSTYGKSYQTLPDAVHEADVNSGSQIVEVIGAGLVVPLLLMV